MRHWRFMALLAACLAGAAIGTRSLSVNIHFPSTTSAQTGSTPTLAPVNITSSLTGTGNPPVSANSSTDASVRQYQRIVKSNGGSTQNYLNLAQAYMQKERETSDVTYYNLTDESLNAALKLDPTNYQAINYKAWVALGRHDFVQAAAYARRAIAAAPRTSANYGTLGDAEANLGNYPAMIAAYQTMMNLKPSLASYNRASYVRWLYGDLRNAVRFMLMAIHAGSPIAENVAWCETQLADDVFNDGAVLPARSEYLAALKTFPNYPRALAGMAAVEYSLGHTRAAIKYYQQAIAVVPLPQFITSLGDLYTAIGDRKAAEQQYALIGFENHIFAINHVRYGIESAQFDADHNRNLKQALRVARAEAAVRHDVQTMDTLAWVLYKNGQYTAAWQAEHDALRLKTRFAPFLFHAGMIEAKLGKVVEAQSYLQSALMMNPNFSILYAPVARSELRRLNAAANRPVSPSKP